jgi:hypothetical protein
LYVNTERCQKVDMNKAPYLDPTNFRHHHAKFNSPGDLATGISAPLIYRVKAMLVPFLNMHHAKQTM